MKRWPIVAAGTAGAVIGFLGTVYVGMAMGLPTSLTTTAIVVLVIICPVIYANLVEMVARSHSECSALQRNSVRDSQVAFCNSATG